MDPKRRPSVNALRVLSRNYQASLEVYLAADSLPGPEAAQQLGARAAALELSILEVARIHGEALSALLAQNHRSDAADQVVRHASSFFAEALTPIEQTHRGAREENLRMHAATDTLGERNRELAALRENLQEEILKRETAETALRTSELTSSQLLQKSWQLQEELRHLSHQLMSSQEEERKRISRELHDVVAQALTGIKVRLAALKTESAANSRDLVKRISTAQKLMEDSVAIVQEFARNLRPAALDDLGLISALRSYLRGVTERTGLRFSLSASAQMEKLESDKRTALFRIVQEAVTNIIRHANASDVKVSIRKQRGAVSMTIQDNGKGFEVEKIGASDVAKRLGLLGMRERVELVGGSLSVESTPGQGTTVRADVPRRMPRARNHVEPSSTPPS